MSRLLSAAVLLTVTVPLSAAEPAKARGPVQLTDEALRIHRDAIAIHEELARRDPENDQHRTDLGWCWRYLGLALAASGDRDSALEQLLRATAIHEERAHRASAEQAAHVVEILEAAATSIRDRGRQVDIVSTVVPPPLMPWAEGVTA